jgi:hypothetical protein
VSRRVRGPVTTALGWLVPLVLAVGAGAGAWVLTERRSAYELPPPGDRVQQAVDALAESPVFVAEDARDLLDEAGEARVAEVAAAADPRIFVVVWTPSTDAGYYLEADALDQIMEGVDEDGIYLLVDDSQSAVVDERGVELDGYVVPELYGALDEALVDHLEELDALGASPAETGEDAYWGPPPGAAVIGVLTALGSYGAVMLLIGIARVVAGRPFRLPTTSTWPRRLAERMGQR